MARAWLLSIAMAAVMVAGCAQAPMTSSSGWIALLDGPRGFDENWQKIGAANWRIVDGIAQADTGEAGKSTEANIFDQRPDPKYGTGAITHLATIHDGPKAGGKWNTCDIAAQGPRIVVFMNGTKTAETDAAHALRGNIGLQWAAGVLKFRKVEIKPL